MSTLSSFSGGGGGGGINSIQRGTTTGSATITISAVDTSKAFINSSYNSAGSTSAGTGFYTGFNYYNGNYQNAANSFGVGYGYGYGKSGGRVALTNSTTVTVTATDTNTTTYWEVIEYA